jgi:hypothetical protein
MSEKITLSPPTTEHLRAYVTALRSGEYVQTKFFLRELVNNRRHDECPHYCYCAEGLLMLLYEKLTGRKLSKVWSVLGVIPSVKTFFFDNHPPNLVALNDTYELTFPQIADEIERTYVC